MCFFQDYVGHGDVTASCCAANGTKTPNLESRLTLAKTMISAHVWHQISNVLRRRAREEPAASSSQRVSTDFFGPTAAPLLASMTNTELTESSQANQPELIHLT